MLSCFQGFFTFDPPHVSPPISVGQEQETRIRSSDALPPDFKHITTFISDWLRA